MAAFIAKLKSEPAVVIAGLAAVLVAAVQAAAGHNLIGASVADFIATAFDPDKGGWAIVLITGIVTRFFVSPATS